MAVEFKDKSQRFKVTHNYMTTSNECSCKIRYAYNLRNSFLTKMLATVTSHSFYLCEFNKANTLNIAVADKDML